MPGLPTLLYPILLLLTAADAGAAVPSAACPAPFLAGERLERSLAGGRTEVALELEADHYIRLTVEQNAADLKVTVLAPSGGVVVERDGPGPAAESVSWLSREPGAYRLVVETPGEAAAPPPTASLRCEGYRPAVPTDEDRVAADFALSSAIQLDESGRQLDRALAYAREAAELWQRLGEPSQELEAILRGGFLHLSLAHQKEAVGEFHKALAMARSLNDLRSQVRALRSLTIACLESDPNSASAYAMEGLSKARELGDAELMANVEENLGNALFWAGRTEQALGAYEAALALAEPLAATAIEARVLNGIGVAQTRMGNSEKGLESHLRALTVSTREGYLAIKAAALTSIGQLRARRGELQESLDALLEAREINQSRGDRAREAIVLDHLGVVMLDLGEPKLARDYFTEALASGYLSGWRRDLARVNVAHTYILLGEPEQALELLATLLASQPTDTRTRASALRSRGLAYLKRKLPGEALESFSQALPLWREAGDRLGEAATLRDTGWALRAAGKLDEARAALSLALQAALRINAWTIETSVFYGLAAVERDAGDLAAALRHIARAVDGLRSVRASLPGDRLRSSFGASKQEFFDLYVNLLASLGDVPGALEASEAARSRGLLDLLAEGRVEVTRGISEKLKGLEREVNARLAGVQLDLSDALGASAPDPARIALLKQRLDEAVADRDLLELRIRNENPRYADVRYPLPLRLQEIQARLQPDAALVEYWIGADGSHVFVATNESVTARTLPPASEIAERVESFSRSVESPDPRNQSTYVSAARWLYDALVAPVEPALTGKKQLIISPDGPLHALAFEALLTRDTGSPGFKELPYLLRDFAVSYVPSASVLSWLTPREPAVSGLRFVAFADPVYGAAERGPSEPSPARGSLPSRSGLPSLRGSEQEVLEIADLYPKDEVRLFLRESANQRNVSGAEVSSAERIHFAVHGFLNPERPELSGLVLSKTGDPGDDGLLQVYEIFNLDLSVQLVVLSACETGGTEVIGEGLVGLARAFLYAGATSVVVSLWRIRDDSAPVLMTPFYRALAERRGAAQALREAKLALLAGDLAHPRHWAPFILVGQSQ